MHIFFDQHSIKKKLSSFPLLLGTLTTNQMRVSKGFIGRKEFFNIPEGLNSITKSALVECICLCSNSNSIIKEKELKGSKTECALLELVEAIGVNYSVI